MYTLKFENNTLKLVANTGDLLLNQSFMPAGANTEKRAWANSAEAFEFWDANLRGMFDHISNTEITIEE